MINCIQQRNPGAGFLGSHRRFCTYCDRDATCHVRDGNWCGNVCREHARKFQPAQVEEGVFVVASSTTGSASVNLTVDGAGKG